MGKSLTETAKAILMKEGVVPSVSSSDNNPDRDATSSTINKASLRPKSKTSENPFSNPGSKAPDSSDVQDLGPALTKAGDTPPSAKAADKLGKDTSASSQSRKGAVAAEKPKKQAEVMEEDIDNGDDVLEEEIELSEELVEFIDALVAEGLSEEEITQAIEENFTFEDSDVLEEEDDYQIDMSEHVEALLQGEDLSEEFKEKATTIFEAAVKQQVEAELALMEQAFAEQLEEEVANIQEEISSNVDDYLNYVVESWVADNEVAIEAGLRTELTEDFISGLRTLFAEHYIDIPEDKVSVIDELGAKVSELESKLNEEIETNVALNKMLSESKKYEVISSSVDGLTATQAEKLKSLAEGVDFTTADEFAHKLMTIRENYFPSGTVKNSNVLDKAESANDGKGMISEELRGPMAHYVKALGKSLPN